jgi:hypothetical protein
MAYTIKFNRYGSEKDCFEKRDRVLSYLIARLEKEGRFRATLTPTSIWGKGGVVMPAIIVKPVRLVKAKPYCLQHYGPCPVDFFTGKPPKKKNSKCLEFEDWVRFHNFVNRCLNRFRTDADVWSTPTEGGISKMYIRRGLRPRVKWEAEEIYDDRGRHIGKWNAGDESQFEAV